MADEIDFNGWASAEPTAFGTGPSGAATGAASPLGVDIGIMPDLDPGFALVSGTRALGEALARRLETPRGGLWYAPDYGYDVRGKLNKALAPAELAAMQGEIEAECEKDERVLSAAASVTFTAQASRLAIAISITTATGPFSLVLSADALSVQLLQVQPS